MNTNTIISEEISDIFTLNKQIPFKHFEFRKSEFHLYITSVNLVVDSENINWQQLITQLELKLHVSYNNINTAPFAEAAAISFPIHLFFTPNQIQPVFQLNKFIDKQVFGSHFNFDNIDLFNVTIELIEKQLVNESYNLQVEIKR